MYSSLGSIIHIVCLVLQRISDGGYHTHFLFIGDVCFVDGEFALTCFHNLVDGRVAVLCELAGGLLGIADRLCQLAVKGLRSQRTNNKQYPLHILIDF